MRSSDYEENRREMGRWVKRSRHLKGVKLGLTL